MRSQKELGREQMGFKDSQFLKLNCKYIVMTVGAMAILFLHYIQI